MQEAGLMEEKKTRSEGLGMDKGIVNRVWT